MKDEMELTVEESVELSDPNNPESNLTQSPSILE